MSGYGTGPQCGYPCNMPCPNNPNEMCGGAKANSVYSTSCVNNISKKHMY